MSNRMMAILFAASMAVATGAAWAQSTPDASIATDRMVASAKEAVVAERSEAVDPAHAGNKQAASSFPPSGRFVLLGMGVVLVGVLARQRRGFRRSATILLR